MTIFSKLQLRVFERKLRQSKKDVDTTFKTLRDRMLKRLYYLVVTRTPVAAPAYAHSALARSNWFMSERNIMVRIEPLDIYDLAEQLWRVYENIENYRTYSNIFINNNIFYVQFLERGSPTTKATMMLDRGLRQVVSEFGVGFEVDRKIGVYEYAGQREFQRAFKL